jgi:hypothetical protein
MSDKEHRIGCGWYINLIGGLATFAFAAYFAVWEIMEFGIDNPGVLILTMLFTVGPIIIIGLAISMLLGKLAGG